MQWHGSSSYWDGLKSIGVESFLGKNRFTESSTCWDHLNVAKNNHKSICVFHDWDHKFDVGALATSPCTPNVAFQLPDENFVKGRAVIHISFQCRIPSPHSKPIVGVLPCKFVRLEPQAIGCHLIVCRLTAVCLGSLHATTLIVEDQLVPRDTTLRRLQSYLLWNRLALTQFLSCFIRVGQFDIFSGILNFWKTWHTLYFR